MSTNRIGIIVAIIIAIILGGSIWYFYFKEPEETPYIDPTEGPSEGPSEGPAEGPAEGPSGGPIDNVEEEEPLTSGYKIRGAPF